MSPHMYKFNIQYTNIYQNRIIKRFTCLTYKIRDESVSKRSKSTSPYCLFVCMFICSFVRVFVCLFVNLFVSSIFHSCGDVTMIGEGLQILTYARHPWPSSSVGSLACHTYCETAHPFIMVISEGPWHSHLLPSV